MALQSSFSIHDEKYDDDGLIKRTGSWVTASAHIVTAVIGSGVLSLAWAVAQLGWIAGCIVLILFSLITLLTSFLLADCYRYPDSVHGIRNPTYMAMVKSILGSHKIQSLINVLLSRHIFGSYFGQNLYFYIQFQSKFILVKSKVNLDLRIEI
ncbi:putative amino acid transporter, transmembrane domain-containing protein [Medicago truncatula]|uniref:Putative amino acid transporter, transmembrane domain-containing protein n=1 Tax=Medicago truncatula TaxID=3880 RepID=A0A396JX69_MEDTR|nr:putative amino acid transporter, transmembrane domain-containing protein [Medicago truncatula]